MQRRLKTAAGLFGLLKMHNKFLFCWRPLTEVRPPLVAGGCSDVEAALPPVSSKMTAAERRKGQQQFFLLLFPKLKESKGATKRDTRPHSIPLQSRNN